MSYIDRKRGNLEVLLKNFTRNKYCRIPLLDHSDNETIPAYFTILKVPDSQMWWNSTLVLKPAIDQDHFLKVQRAVLINSDFLFNCSSVVVSWNKVLYADCLVLVDQRNWLDRNIITYYVFFSQSNQNNTCIYSYFATECY